MLARGWLAAIAGGFHPGRPGRGRPHHRPRADSGAREGRCGVAQERATRQASPRSEFRILLDHKGASGGSTWRFPNWGLYYSISHLGLARASVLAGDAANAPSLRGLLRIVDGRRPRHPDPQASSGGIRQATALRTSSTTTWIDRVSWASWCGIAIQAERPGIVGASQTARSARTTVGPERVGRPRRGPLRRAAGRCQARMIASEGSP